MTFNGLHGVISQKIELFITTAVRTSNPTTITHILTLTVADRSICPALIKGLQDVHKARIVNKASELYVCKSKAR
jgi:hypothetical protein